ncbi:oligosaccharide flippase family protein [Niveibacterium sp. 24ML]|uniref:lipopolysaccharide biosynthesis protein n=1 Tax=Niveibacterium sp. 24ML TaxID=2985512 RepID=UPI00226EB780|nr:oligosaccharide flippase family protein [Niveibacterium sp. 24ML]MCX9156659.1 oligosaccharide flippase family protein [Niveibacterium sp. 24ML]
MKSNLALSLTALIARALSSIIVFAVLAREWGATGFGQFAFVFGVATMSSLLSEFGFSTHALQRFSRVATNEARFLVDEIVSVKLSLGLVVVLGNTAIALTGWFGDGAIQIAIALSVAAVALGFSDFYTAVLRSIDSFALDAVISSTVNLSLFFAVMLGVHFGYGRPIHVALAFCVARLIGMLLSMAILSDKLGRPRLAFGGVSAMRTTIRANGNYALESGLWTAYTNVDLILIRSFLGLHAVGVFQIGFRLFQGAMQFVPVLNSVFVPKLARAHVDLSPPSSSMRVTYLVFGCGCGVGLLGAGVYAPLWLRHESFVGIESIFALFGALCIVRYLYAYVGAQLLAIGAQRSRVIAIAAGAVVLIPAALLGMHVYGVAGMVVAHLLSTSVMLAVCAHSLKKLKSQTSIGRSE